MTVKEVFEYIKNEVKEASETRNVRRLFVEIDDIEGNDFIEYAIDWKFEKEEAND